MRSISSKPNRNGLESDGTRVIVLKALAKSDFDVGSGWHPGRGRAMRSRRFLIWAGRVKGSRTRPFRPFGRVFGGSMPSLPTLPTLTVRALRARAVEVPLTFVLGTSQQALRSVPLVLIDLETEEGVTGRAYL